MSDEQTTVSEKPEVARETPTAQDNSEFIRYVVLLGCIATLGFLSFNGLEFGKPRPRLKRVSGTLMNVQPARRQRPREVGFSEPLLGKRFTDDIGIEFVWIEPGMFRMGSTGWDKDRVKNEVPQHSVLLTKGFYLSVCEVTNEQWATVMDDKTRYADKPRYPASGLSWRKCMSFCSKRTQATKRHYTLPTEAQWEYACRAGTTTAFSTGSTLGPFEANIAGDYERGIGRPPGRPREPMNVGSFSPNAFGLYDMHGNVWEWCDDYQRRYTAANETDPRGKTNYGHVIRGGDYRSDARDCRSARRAPPTFARGRLAFAASSTGC